MQKSHTARVQRFLPPCSLWLWEARALNVYLRAAVLFSAGSQWVQHAPLLRRKVEQNETVKVTPEPVKPLEVYYSGSALKWRLFFQKRFYFSCTGEGGGCWGSRWRYKFHLRCILHWKDVIIMEFCKVSMSVSTYLEPSAADSQSLSNDKVSQSSRS